MELLVHCNLEVLSPCVIDLLKSKTFHLFQFSFFLLDPAHYFCQSGSYFCTSDLLTLLAEAASAVAPRADSL